MTEEWRNIPGWEGYYQLSNLGRVRSLDRVVPWRGTTQLLRGRILSEHESATGYRVVDLYRNSQRTTKAVHRLLLLVFVGPPPVANMDACHNDGDRLNNALGNLRWATRTENNLDAVAHGTNWLSRRTHCKNGHEYTAENTRIHRSARVCVACKSAVSSRYEQRRSAARKAGAA